MMFNLHLTDLSCTLQYQLLIYYGGFYMGTLDDVKTVIADVMKIDTKGIKPDTKFIEDLKADSMDQFFLIDGFCEKFNITISDEDARLIRTVSDAVNYIDSHKK